MSCKRKQVNYLIILPLLSVSSSNRKLPMLPNRRLVPKFPRKESQVELVRKIQKRILLFLRKKSVKKSDDWQNNAIYKNQDPFPRASGVFFIMHNLKNSPDIEHFWKWVSNGNKELVWFVAPEFVELGSFFFIVVACLNHFRRLQLQLLTYCWMNAEALNTYFLSLTEKR